MFVTYACVKLKCIYVYMHIHILKCIYAYILKKNTLKNTNIHIHTQLVLF